jgi:DNA-binding NarL/FixJ family response regulator
VQAVEDLQRHPDRYELAQARRDLDAIRWASVPHEPRPASAAAVPALAIAANTAVAVPAQSLRMLSGAERRVADLAALGHTNRSISAELCITVSTVEQHLTRIYRKLGIRQRGQLRLFTQ